MDANPRTAIVVAGGDRPDGAVLDRLPPSDLVVAADGGLDHALALGLAVDVAVGDFDSASPEAIDEAAAAGTAIERHPVAKEHIDLELALDAAVARGARRLVVLGGAGGRLDLLVANALLLAAAAYAGLAVEAHAGGARVYVVRDELVVAAARGQVLSLLPVHGPALGVRTEGLRYPLDDEDLPAGTSRGCSNVIVAPLAMVRVREGVLLAVLPGLAVDDHQDGGNP